jgi:hypothetical protein
MTNLMHFEIVSLELALPHIKAGSVKPLAVMTDKRVADLPDVPTIAEAGFPEATYVPWYGIYVQAGTPMPSSRRSTTASTRRCRTRKCSASSRSPIFRASRCRSRSRRADEGGSREADEGDRDVGHGAAVRYRTASPVMQERSASNPILRQTEMDCFAARIAE